MTTNKTFSVVTITYNNRAGLEKTAHSIIAQTCADYEWLIIDGASTDGTHKDFSMYPSAVIISEPDQGIYDAMNKGLGRAAGRYIIFMNAGDQFSNKDILQTVKDRIFSSPDLIYGDSFEETKSGTRHYKRAKPALQIARGLFTHHQSIFYNRQSLGMRRYDLSYKIAADYHLTLNFLKEHKITSYIPIPISIFEDGGISQRNVTLGRDEQFRARKEYGIANWKNLFLTQKQKAASCLRRYCPNLFWRLKRKAP
ncbi:MAG: glycosyltransferase family 2 protein [Pseudobdellovibrionaceae bacterium]|jgi:putative colanic acid biosynthesis glycosyltransferase|nr:glycosyltransferase family 2 protein [Pseudobdellovibrionaceae bacterium]